MHTIRCLIAAGVLVAGALVAWGEDPAPKGTETVPARRYRTWVVEGALEASHGGGRWIEELFFPEQGVVANVTETTDFSKPTFPTSHVLNAFHGTMRNRFRKGLQDEKETETPVEDVRVPLAMAKEIFEVAELHRRWEAARASVGAHVSEAGLCRDLDADGKAIEPPGAGRK